MLFKDLQGLDGIDKLNECVPLVDEIFADKELCEKIKTIPTLQAAAHIYKAHSKAIDTIMNILGEKPENNSTIATIAATSRIISSIYSDEETLAFFTVACPSLKSMILPMANTEDEQSADL